MKTRRIKALVIKEFYQIIKDPSSLLISFFLPVLLLFLYGFAISFDLKHVKLAVVLEDSSPKARSFCDALSFSKYFDVTITREREVAEQGVLEGKYKGFVVIPSYFTAFTFKESLPAPIQVISDGSEPNTATFIQNYVRGAFNNWIAIENFQHGIKNPQGIIIDTRVWFNPSLESRFFFGSRIACSDFNIDWNSFDLTGYRKRLGKRDYGKSDVYTCPHGRNFDF